MKKIKYTIGKFFLVATVTTTVFSCSPIESEPLQWNTEDQVLDPKDSSAVNMKGLFNAVYIALPTLHTRLQSSYLDAATDNGVATRDLGGDESLDHYRDGSLSPANIASLDGNAWSRNYEGIRKANLFLKSIEGYPSSTQLPDYMITTMKAEARAVRAFYYFELLKRWGGVPLIGDKVLDLNDDINIPRSSIDEVAKYILNEISPEVESSCFNDLYDEVPDAAYGRFNKGAVLGFISRVKLYLASPLYNKSNDLSKWKAAADAAEAVINTGKYDLHPSFLDFFGKNESYPNKEMMIVKAESSSSTTLESNNSPTGYDHNRCHGLTSPSQNLVDAFLTIDGKNIQDENSGYDPQNPYENRDPRLKFTVFYNGMMWLKRGVETFEGGLDKVNVAGKFTTQTGYYLRKFLADNENRTTLTGSRKTFHILRYAEVLLNYAEALNEYDYTANKTQIEEAIIKLRKRAGINPGDDNRYGLPAQSTQDDMREIIRNERRIELAFEDHRMWDVKRWMIADQGPAVFTKPVRGVVITKDSEKLVYKYVDVKSSKFEPKMYWYPISRNEIKGNTALVQNEGWDY